MIPVRLSPDEAAQFLATSERLDGFVAGVRALAEHLKQQKVNELVAARPLEPNPAPPKE